METKGLISVIVPVYKVEEYLDECVSSIVNQTYRNLEIILVDDGSPDNCPQMCDEWAKKDGRIRVIHKKNGGLSSARNSGLDVATGNYIGFVDSDDYIKKDMYASLLKGFLENESVGIVSCLVHSFNEDNYDVFKPEWNIKKERIIQSERFAEKLLSSEVNFTVWSKLYRADLLKGICFQEGKINEDSLFIFDLSKKIEQQGLQMLEIPYRGYYYRQRPNSICSSTTRPLALDAIENFHMMQRYYKEAGNEHMTSVITRYLALRYIRFTDQITQNKEWKEQYKKLAYSYLEKLNLRKVLSYHFPLKVILRYLLLRHAPYIYENYLHIKEKA